jgi:hypothetical protein
MANNGNGTGTLAALGRLFGRPDQGATEMTLGHTPRPPTEPPAPRLDSVYGQTGRANFWGLPQWDEINAKLIGPAGQQMFDTMYRTDPDIHRLVLMVASPIQAGSWALNPYGGDDASDQDRQIADTIWWALNNYMAPNFTQHLSEALPLMIRAGFAAFEQVWSTTTYKGKSLTLPKSLQVRLPRSIWRWWQDDFGALTHIGQLLPNKPETIIPASELVYYRLGAEGDNWMGTSLLRSAFKPWMIKDKLERIDAIGQERKAVGVPIIYPPTNADAQTKGEVETLFASMHLSEAAFAMMPGPKQGLTGMNPGEGWLVDVIKFDSGSGESIQKSLTYHQLAIAGSVLGDFMQLGHHQVGARATADIQEDPFLTAEDAFAQIGPIPPLNKLVDRITKLNWPGAEGSPTLTLNLTDAASLSEIAAYVQLLISAGAMNADNELEDWLRERADLPPANSDVRALQQAASEAALKASALQASGPQMNPVTQPPETIAPEAKPKGDPTTAPAYPGNGNKPKTKLDTPSAKWYENLLSQGKIVEALDGARGSVETAAMPAATMLAQHIATGLVHPTMPDTSALASAMQGEYERLYTVGHQTASEELAKQKKTLMSPSDVAAAVGARFARAKQRAEQSAVNIAHEIAKRVSQAQITGLKDAPQLSSAALEAAQRQIHQEALDNASAMVNDGRYDAAAQNGAVAAIYTSVLDGNTCDDCETADTGDLVSLDDMIETPNPDCQGGDRCRCMNVFLMSDDPALAQV